MLDLRGIQLSEVTNKYPKRAQLLGYDVLLDVDEFHKPKIISSFEMCINIIITLLLMKPGQYPSIPELGIYIEQYLFEYSDDNSILDKVMNQLQDQCNRIGMMGIEINVFFNKIDPSRNELCVEIRGTEQIAKGSENSVVVIGISYDRLNRLYVNRYHNGNMEYKVFRGDKYE